MAELGAKVKHDKDLGAVIITFVFEKWQWKNIEALAGLMKLTIPASARDYNATTHEWTILEPFWIPLKTLLEQAKFKITEEKLVKEEDFFYNQGVPSDSHEMSKEELANQLLALLDISAEELADFNKAKRAFRRKAMEWHPDRNQGDGSRMSELNSVWSAYNNHVN